MSYTIIRTGGKQFAVESGQTIRVPSIQAEAGKKVDIDTIFADGKAAGASIKATVVSHGLGDKIIVFKKKRRKQYKRKQGHRQGFTEIKID
jgi:large subunit ribosomal protein L21